VGKTFTANDYHLMASGWAQTLFKTIPGWNINIRGKEHIPSIKQTNYIIVANHESAVDILAIYFLNIQFRWLAKKEIFKFPLIGHTMKSSGYVPIKRGCRESHQQALEKCKHILRTNTPLLFFPEGTRSTAGSPKTFKLGAFRLALEHNLPILPIVIKGSNRLLTKGSLAPNKETVQIEVLPPTMHNKGEDVVDYTKRVQRIIVDKHSKSSL
jgi:1-acyl-sn-glycerol-3-phosphate acyltransferase